MLRIDSGHLGNHQKNRCNILTDRVISSWPFIFQPSCPDPRRTRIGAKIGGVVSDTRAVAAVRACDGWFQRACV
jgi:hypothetical protein